MNSEQTYTPSLSITKQQRIPALGSTRLPFPHGYDNQAVVASTENVTVSATSSHPGSLDHLASDVFVGREREMGALREDLEETLVGRGRVVVLTGEPGIGKTRTAIELAAYAQLQGARVLRVIAMKGKGGAAFLAVGTAAAHLRTECPLERLRTEMGLGRRTSLKSWRAVRDRLPDLPASPQLESEQARFRFFDSVATFLKSASRTKPLVLLFDDLHGRIPPPFYSYSSSHASWGTLAFWLSSPVVTGSSIVPVLSPRLSAPWPGRRAVGRLSSKGSVRLTWPISWKLLPAACHLRNWPTLSTNKPRDILFHD
jgi:hypothetical protein